MRKNIHLPGGGGGGRGYSFTLTMLYVCKYQFAKLNHPQSKKE